LEHFAAQNQRQLDELPKFYTAPLKHLYVLPTLCHIFPGFNVHL